MGLEEVCLNNLVAMTSDISRYGEGSAQIAPARMLVSELGSLSLEFTRLSQLTGDPKYYDAVQRIADEFEKSQNTTKLPGMWPVSIDAQKPAFWEDTLFTLGGMSDSLYEYFPKQFLLLGGLLSQPRTLYENFIEVAKKHMFFRIYNPDDLPIMVSGDIRVRPGGVVDLQPRGQHLTCFAGGMIALASQIFERPGDLKVAEELAAGCVWAYDMSANGIAPEIFTVMPCPKNNDCKWSEKVWHDALKLAYNIAGTNGDVDVQHKIHDTISGRRLPPGFTSIDDRRYILRPEAIESVFLMWRITGDRKWQEAAWRMFERIEQVSRTEFAAAAIQDITQTGDQLQQVDSMESFWLAETLKYFYLCFEEFGVVSLDEFVLNTEAHPLRRPR
jgi:mannosyl-oligosaccharide alpha-1,2-mannosidase